MSSRCSRNVGHRPGERSSGALRLVRRLPRGRRREGMRNPRKRNEPVRIVIRSCSSDSCRGSDPVFAGGQCKRSDPVFGLRNMRQALNSSYEQAVESRVPWRLSIISVFRTSPVD